MESSSSRGDGENGFNPGPFASFCISIAFFIFVTLVLAGFYIAQHEEDKNYVQTTCFVIKAQLSSDWCYESDDSDDSTTADPYYTASRRPSPTKTTTRRLYQIHHPAWSSIRRPPS